MINLISYLHLINTGCYETEFHIENFKYFDVELSCLNYVIFAIECYETEFHIWNHKKLARFWSQELGTTVPCAVLYVHGILYSWTNILYVYCENVDANEFLNVDHISW